MFFNEGGESDEESLEDGSTLEEADVPEAETDKATVKVKVFYVAGIGQDVPVIRSQRPIIFLS